MKKKELLVLIFIILLAFGLRFYRIDSVPPSLNWDEVSIGYNAYSILKTGRDEWGQLFPVHFEAYGEYKLPAQIYLSIPGILIFGLNELGVRITPVLYGSATVVVIYFLGRLIFQSSIAGLAAAFLLAVSPWHIQLTRASFESSLATLFITIGIWLLAKGFTEKKWLVYAMIPFALATYTYNSARVFAPFFLVVVCFLYIKKFIHLRSTVVVAFILFIVLLFPAMPYFFSSDRSSRYKLVSITDDPGLVLRINENRGNSNLPSPLPRLIHNKVTYISFYTAKNYLAHFTPQYLFVSGAPHKQHHVQNVGELYFFQVPLLLAGIWQLFKSKNKYMRLLFAWVIIGVIPVAVTNDSIPHALRTLLVSPFYQLISGFGILSYWNWVKKMRTKTKITHLLFTVMTLIFSVGFYLNQYFDIYPKLYSRDWQYGYKQVVEFIDKNQGRYDIIVFSRHFGEPHMFTLFFMGYDPAKFQNNPNLNRFETHNWVRVLEFDKFYFPDLGDKGTRYEDILSQNKDKRILFIGRSGDFPQDLKRLSTVNFLDGQVAFEIIDNLNE